jgi:hypothetical protein
VNQGAEPKTRYNLAAFDKTYGLATDWTPVIDGTVYTIELTDNSLFVGGAFSMANGISRRNAAAIDLSDGTLTDWDPSFSGDVGDLKIFGDSIYSSGRFTRVNISSNATTRNKVAAFDLTKGTATGWDPNIGLNLDPFLTPIVDELMVNGSKINAVGNFDAANNNTKIRRSYAVFNATDGTTVDN